MASWPFAIFRQPNGELEGNSRLCDMPRNDHVTWLMAVPHDTAGSSRSCASKQIVSRVVGETDLWSLNRKRSASGNCFLSLLSRPTLRHRQIRQSNIRKH
ncbi:hypothetical protein J6590_018387 [Homalodisca vitripennis]|nr:hypothetical protein J6590_018387 [Homalodisca vitripennis]